MRTILLKFERNQQCKQVVNLCSCPEKEDIQEEKIKLHIFKLGSEKTSKFSNQNHTRVTENVWESSPGFSQYPKERTEGKGKVTLLL